MTGRLKVLVSTSSFGTVSPEPLDRLEERGVEVALNPHGRTLRADEIAGLLRDVDGLIAGTEPLTAEVMAAAPKLRVISRVGVGIDNVDLAAADARGIVVRNTPDAVTEAVAELTIGGMLVLLRHLRIGDAEVRAGAWSKRMGGLLAGTTVGVIGLGRIGKRVSELVRAFGAAVVANDLLPDDPWATAHAVGLMPVEDVLVRSDIVTLHATGDGGCILDAASLARMRPGALVVNTARGGLIDEDALYGALADGRIGGAYLDVYDREPYDGRLRDLENVLLTPHIGSYAREARLLMELEAVENLWSVLQGDA